jgi:hypothetical protein
VSRFLKLVKLFKFAFVFESLMYSKSLTRKTTNWRATRINLQEVKLIGLYVQSLKLKMLLNN